MWLKDPEDLHQNQLQDHQNHPQDHQNRLQGLQNHTYKKPHQRGAAYWEGSEAPEADFGGPGGGSGGPGAGSDVGPQGPSATWDFATAGLTRPNVALGQVFFCLG